MTQPPIHVSLIAIPDAVISTLGGIYDVMSAFPAVAAVDKGISAAPLFRLDIVGETKGSVALASGLPVRVDRSVEDIEATDIVVVPSVIITDERWSIGRYPALVEWLKRVHDRGAVLCSACSGIFLLAETGLFDGRDATIHWAYASTFKKTFPEVPVTPDKVLVVTGARGELVTSGASTSWHDLVLYLIATRAGPSAALAIARFFALEWHRDGLAPYVVFVPIRDHGDGAILKCQDWLASHYSVAGPVEEMIRRSGLAARTFKRRFSKATGLSAISYVQNVRIEETKRRLERTEKPIDEISWEVGYEDPAFFRRLFKRVTGMTPGMYRRKFKLPAIGN